MVEKNFQTNAVIYKETGEKIAGAEPELKKVKEEKIKMNHPLKFDGYTIYQSGYQQNEFNSMTFKIHKKNGTYNTSLGSFKINLSNPKDTYKQNNGLRVTVIQYY